MFKQGDIVICTNDLPPLQGWEHAFKQWPIKGDKYTIRRCYQTLTGDWGVLLEELKNPSKPQPALGGNVEPGFSHSRFRKVEDIGTLIKTEELEEIFESLLV